MTEKVANAIVGGMMATSCLAGVKAKAELKKIEHRKYKKYYEEDQPFTYDREADLDASSTMLGIGVTCWVYITQVMIIKGIDKIVNG